MPLQVLECDLKRVIFQGDNGFIIGNFSVPLSGSVPALGDLLTPQVGAKYRLHGDWVENKKFGRQFKFKSYETIEPKSSQGIYRYIVHTAKWVGPATGKKIIEEYGEETLNILRTNPTKVAKEIRGITLARAIDIQEKMLENKNIEHLMVQIEAIVGGLGLRKSLPAEIIKRWKSKSLDALKQNPYVLCKLDNVGFLTADRIAMERLKIPLESFNRKVAAIEYVMKENENNGNVWIEANDLVNRSAQLTECDCKQAIVDISKEYLEIDSKRYIANKKAANDERYIAEKLKRMLL